MAEKPQIAGLPPGAELKPIEGLPEGAEVRPIGGGNVLDQPTSDSGTFSGGLGNVVSRIGSNIGALAKPFLHPSQIPETMAGNMGNMVRSVTRGETQPDMMSDFRQTYAQDKPKAFENLAGDVGTAALVGGITHGAIRGIPKAFEAAQNFRPTSSPEIVPPLQTAAENLAGSIVPKAKQVPGFVNDIQRNAGNIRDYVKETNNPLKTQAEFEKAVQGAGNRRYEHFTKNILGPIADQPIPVPEGYGGTVSGEGTAKLGDIHQRIGRLNQLTSPAYAKANPGDVANALAKTPMEALQAEHAAITPAFQDAVASATGIPVEDIANLRQDFGSLRGLGNTVTEARAGRIAKVGGANEGGTVPTSKAGVLEKVWQGLHGGQDAMANRALQKAWRGFEPLAGEGRPLPQSPEGFQAQRAFQESANQEAARAETTRAHESEMAAQDQAAQRSQQTQARRQQRASVYRGTANVEQENAAMREQQAQQASADRSKTARMLRGKK